MLLSSGVHQYGYPLCALQDMDREINNGRGHGYGHPLQVALTSPPIAASRGRESEAYAACRAATHFLLGSRQWGVQVSMTTLRRTAEATAAVAVAHSSGAEEEEDPSGLERRIRCDAWEADTHNDDAEEEKEEEEEAADLDRQSSFSPV